MISMNTFLEEQFKQLDSIFESYKTDLTSLNDIIASWEESELKDPNALKTSIESRVKNKTSIELSLDEETSRYLFQVVFHPVQVVWSLESDSSQKV